MIKVENIETWGFEHAIRGMRNPFNSWKKSDSCVCHAVYNGDCDRVIEDMSEPVICDDGEFCYCLGQADLDLMRKLYKAGSEHRKFARQIFVSMDITAPLYWIAELDTYKVGTTRNSCSFMHKGVSKPFEINDFAVDDERIYYLLNPISIENKEIFYPYETIEYKTYVCENGREYLVFKNGRIFRKAFNYTDTKGRRREFEEEEVTPTLTKQGYYVVSLGGRCGEKWLLHRLIASMWIDNPNGYDTVNHIDGDKSNNSFENLEWCVRSENIRKGFEDGLYDENKLHLAYNSWKNGHKLSPFEKLKIKNMIKKHGVTYEEISNKYNISKSTIGNMVNAKPCENADLFMHAYTWEKIIETLNELRALYLETKDFEYFRAIRQLLPQGYNVRFTFTMNYENVFSMIKQRTGHKLDEWNDFVEVLKALPYVKEIIE